MRGTQRSRWRDQGEKGEGQGATLYRRGQVSGTPYPVFQIGVIVMQRGMWRSGLLSWIPFDSLGGITYRYKCSQEEVLAGLSQTVGLNNETVCCEGDFSG